MQRNDELQAAGLPADFFKVKRERRQAQGEMEGEIMAAKRRAELAEIRAMRGRVERRPSDFTWIGGRASRRSVEKALRR